MQPLRESIWWHITHLDDVVDWVFYQLSRSTEAHFTSLPSSGTHWLRMILAKGLVEAYHLDYEITTIEPTPLVPTYRSKEQRFLYNDREDIPRIQHSHNPYSFLYRGTNVLILVRDLRDTMASSYDVYIEEEDTIPFSDFLRAEGVDEKRRRTLDHRIEFLNSWWENQEKLNDWKVVRYEDLKSEPESTVQSVFDFVGIDYDSDLIRDTLEFASMENMRRLETEGQAESSKERRSEGDGGRRKVNEGRTRRYNDYFTEPDIDYFERKVKRNLVHYYGYDYLL